MQIRRVLYISRAFPGLLDIDLRQIFGLAEVLHRRGDLGGLLAYTGGHFVQVIEGPAANVAHLLRLIASDRRHRDMRHFCDETSEAREFSGWDALTVDSLDLADEVDDFLARPDAGCAEAKALVRRLLSRGPPETQF